MHKKSEEDHSQPQRQTKNLPTVAVHARVAPPLPYTCTFSLSIPTIVYRKELQYVSIQLTFSHYMLYLPARSSVQ